MYLVTKLHYHKQRRLLDVHFDNGELHSFSSEFLRTHSPSAEVQGHGHKHSLEPTNLVLNKQHVSIERIEPVGHYAARLVFDDGHNSGLFSWQYFHALAKEHETLQAAYLKRVNDVVISQLNSHHKKRRCSRLFCHLIRLGT
ncbi:gamma-butyrobetaine hydroxylase family protein [Pseudoalteromonas xiamenensis]